MRIDMHCHTKEGSIDAKVGVELYAKTLMQMGFDGMLITDHNSYKGYEYWKSIEKDEAFEKPFSVFRGIEYDTRNGGHMIVILPENSDKKAAARLEARGLSVRKLEQLVHSLGGILGPAHPYDTGYYAFMNTRFGKHHPEFLEKFDFIESFNSCAKPYANEQAKLLADRLGLPETAGSDTHRLEVMGTAYTEFSGEIKDNDDLIAAVTRTPRPVVPHEFLRNMHRSRSLVMEKLEIAGYWIYNRAEVLRYMRRRHQTDFRGTQKALPH